VLLFTASGEEAECHRSGLTKLKGLSVAFLDGTYNKSAYRSKSPPGDELAGCRDYTEVRRSDPN